VTFSLAPGAQVVLGKLGQVIELAFSLVVLQVGRVAELDGREALHSHIITWQSRLEAVRMNIIQRY
jgi:hypothetical protein